MHTRYFPSALVAALVVAACSIVTATGASAADGTMTWGVHVSLTPAFFDPADATGTALPLMVYYGVHDALVRPMPGTPMGNALAQSWSMSKDGLVYEFVLRRGVKFHNGDVMTAEDVKFSFERYRGASAALLRWFEKMQQIIHERVMFAPILEYAYFVSIGPRVEYDAVNAIPANPYTAPYEDLRLAKR
jgi:ABC-type transport system substrate-binding protein